MSGMPFEDLVQRLRDLAAQRAGRQKTPFAIPKEKFTEWIAADKLEELRRYIEAQPVGIAEKDGRLLP